MEGIPVGRKADVLFFLHAFHQAEEWQPRNDESAHPPAVFKYVVHYADGKTVEVPVLYGRGVGHWVSDEAARVARRRGRLGGAVPARPAAAGGRLPDAVANPRPGEKIGSIDVTYDDKVGNRYGVPVVLGITAATVKE